KYITEQQIPDSPGRTETITHIEPAARTIVEELERDHLEIIHKTYAYLYQKISDIVKAEKTINPELFYTDENPEVTALTVELLSNKYVLSENWEQMHKIPSAFENIELQKNVMKFIYSYKQKRLDKMLSDIDSKIKEAHLSKEDYSELMKRRK